MPVTSQSNATLATHRCSLDSSEYQAIHVPANNHSSYESGKVGMLSQRNPFPVQCLCCTGSPYKHAMHAAAFCRCCHISFARCCSGSRPADIMTPNCLQAAQQVDTTTAPYRSSSHELLCHVRPNQCWHKVRAAWQCTHNTLPTRPSE
jgi:hypothetical protein